MKSTRVKNTVLNAIVMILNTAIISILSLISTNIILKNYGSDYNGVVATANQLVTLILIVEGGFTTAINVALFKPYVNDEQKKINEIMTAAKKVFIKIGLIFIAIGTLMSIIYPIFIKSNLPYLTIFLIFQMVMIGTAYNLIFVYRNQIMFQVSQKEYVYSFFGIIINALSSITTIILAYNKVDMLIIRFFILVYIIINGIIIYSLFKRTFPKIENAEPDYHSIKGTKDIMVQKLTSVIYLSAPLLTISTFINTKVASVYAVYNSIYNIIKSVITSLIAAPVNGFGQLLSNGKKKEVYKKFELYEYIVILAATLLLSCVLSLIIPFIKLYTLSVTDINYVNYYMAILLAAIVIFEVIHIPSGHIINVTGNFKTAKKIQIYASIVLITLLSIGTYMWQIKGILIATLITNIVLAIMEIYYTHIKIFEENIIRFTIKLFVNIIIIMILAISFNMLNIKVSNYIIFFVTGGIIFIAYTIIIFIINYVLFKKDITNILLIFKRKNQ